MKNKKRMFMMGVFASCMLIPTSVSALTKSETIYANLNYDGSFLKSSVTNHLAFLEKKEEVDETILKDILNINGDEKFKTDGNKIVWENKGRDIFYRGTTEEEIPIDVEVEYFLNGKRRSPKKMIGKKGEVKIVYHFVNKDRKTVQIGGCREDVYTPFVVSVGTIIEGKNNKDFSITNGKVISTGTRSMIVGLSAPGLYESTGISELEGLDDITLSYSTTHFSMQNTYIVATPKMLSEKEFTVLGKVDDLYQSMQALDSNMQKLVSGATEVSSGATTLYDGGKSLRYNMGAMHEASSRLKNGSITLNEGLTALKNAILQMKGSIQNQLQGKSVDEVIATLQNLKAQNQLVIESTLQKSGKSFVELESIYVQNHLQNYQAQGDNDPLGALKNAYELSLLLTGNNSAIDISLNVLSSFHQIDLLLSSIEQLETGSFTLRAGLTTLEDGSKKLYQGSLDIEEGMKKLMEGSEQLKNGSQAFQEQGIKELVGYSNTVKKYSDKMEALVSLSKEYKGFASSNSDSTLFVYTISSIK